jgi:hypothetical protein
MLLYTLLSNAIQYTPLSNATPHLAAPHPWQSTVQACSDYVPAMIQTALYKSPTDTATHRKLLECVMAQKPDVHVDLLHVIAYGPTSAKVCI